MDSLEVFEFWFSSSSVAQQRNVITFEATSNARRASYEAGLPTDGYRYRALFWNLDWISECLSKGEICLESISDFVCYLI